MLPKVRLCCVGILVTTPKLLANSGVQLPLSQYQAGSEQTTLIPNGNFETPGTPDGGQFPNPTGWTRDGNMFVATPTFSSLTNTGSFAAQLRDTLFPGSYSTPAPAMAANKNYVLSAYVWNSGRTGAGSTGDLTTVKLIDPPNGLLNNVSMTLEATASDGGAGSGGYLMYIMVNQAQTAAWGPIQIQVISEYGSIGGALPNPWSQYDNVALTPAVDFVAQKWKTNGSGSWSDNANWTGRNPNELGAIASFTDGITAPATVTVDSARTLAQINFANASSYTLAGTATITLDVTADGFGSAQGVPEIAVLSGSHTISAPISLPRSTILNVDTASSVLTLSNDITSAATISLTKVGAGRVDVKNVRVGELKIDVGTVRVLQTGTANSAASTSRVATLTIAGGPAAPTATLDLGNNSMVIDYSGNTIIDDVRQLLRSGYNSGAWNGTGINSSRAGLPTGDPAHATAIGYLEGSTIAGGTFAGQTVDADSIALKYTYAGDANLDGLVDVADLGALATAWQTSGLWASGDFDYNGTIDVNDLGILATNWQAGVGAPLTPTDGHPWAFTDALAAIGLGGASVPEPTTALLMVLGPLALRRRRRTIIR
jgi:hypothetical protein